MAEPDHAWDWLNRAAEEAREAIDRLYWEGRSQLVDPGAEPPPPGDVWPGGADHHS